MKIGCEEKYKLHSFHVANKCYSLKDCGEYNSFIQSVNEKITRIIYFSESDGKLLNISPEDFEILGRPPRILKKISLEKFVEDRVKKDNNP